MSRIRDIKGGAIGSQAGGSDVPLTVAVILAGGTGERFGAPTGKQLAYAAGRPVLVHAVDAFDAAGTISSIVLVCHPDRVDEYRDVVLASMGGSTPVVAVAGGTTRQESAAAGLRSVSEEVAFVAVHDGARPLITPSAIDTVVWSLCRDESVAGIVMGHPSYDTLKLVEADRIVATPPRDRYWAAQTPQVFRSEVLREAYAAAERDRRVGTDDASLVEAIGAPVRMIEGARENIKVTVDADLAFVEAVLAARGR